jgi:predicted nuclease of restriction endonuclease-like (RecB) superfamily
MAKQKKTSTVSRASRHDRQPLPALPAGYPTLLADLKTRVRNAQLRAAVSVNRELIGLYWDIGKAIVERQKKHKWGDQVIDHLARDLTSAFPQMAGFSRPNLYRMRAFYLGYSPGKPIVAQAVRQLPATASKSLAEELKAERLAPVLAAIPWGQNVILLQKLKDPLLRLWYAHQAVEHGWSRAVLTHHIESQLHQRGGKAITNFQRTLPPPQSDLAEQTLKDPYNFDFLTLRTDARERDLEQGLLDHIRKFLLELGVGFAFVGRQYHLEISGQDYYLDLLFYHLRLRCYVVIDLKMRAFEPEFAGKMNFYLSAVDDQLRHPDDKLSIGLLLCKEHDQLTVDYALRDLKKPIGVAQWQTKLVESLPKNLKSSLPTIAEIETELGKSKGK